MCGKLSLCLISSCGIACLWKEVNWVLKYTKNTPNYGEKSLAGLVQRRGPCVKPILVLMIYGDTCLLEPIVREYLPQSLLVYSEDFSKIWSEIWSSNPWITAVASHWGTLFYYEMNKWPVRTWSLTISAQYRCHKLHSAISPSIIQQFSWSQQLLKALEKTFQLIPVTPRSNQ